MKAVSATFRNIAYLTGMLALSITLAACSGGGSGSASYTGGGASSVGVSLASAPAFPAGTTFSTSAAPASGTPIPASTSFDHVWVVVTRLALIPSAGAEHPDQDGELEAVNDPSEEGDSGHTGFVTIVLPTPVRIDLLNPPTARQVAKFLNKHSDIPPGEYSKIRVYYSSVVGEDSEGLLTTFHQTAHYHFDVHFVGGNLLIPVAADPAGGIRFYSISIHVVGLKIHQAGKSDNFLLRPQVFATVDATKYIVSGEALNVNPSAGTSGTFNILTFGGGGETVSAAYGADTHWIYVDNLVPSVAWSSAGAFLGSNGLRDTATVDVIGTFSSGKVLQAEEVDVTFPATRNGKVYLGWKPDNTFTIRLTLDNVTPMPGRTTAYYDNAVDPSYAHLPNGDQAIVDNVAVTARGYAVSGGIQAFWISVGP